MRISNENIKKKNFFNNDYGIDRAAKLQNKAKLQNNGNCKITETAK